MDMDTFRGLMTASLCSCSLSESGHLDLEPESYGDFRGGGAVCRWMIRHCRHRMTISGGKTNECDDELGGNPRRSTFVAGMFLVDRLDQSSARIGCRRSRNPRVTSGTRTFGSSTTPCQCGGCTLFVITLFSGAALPHAAVPRTGEFRRHPGLVTGRAVRSQRLLRPRNATGRSSPDSAVPMDHAELVNNTEALGIGRPSLYRELLLSVPRIRSTRRSSASRTSPTATGCTAERRRTSSTRFSTVAQASCPRSVRHWVKTSTTWWRTSPTCRTASTPAARFTRST